MDSITGDLSDIVTCYCDDALVFSEGSLQDHLKAIERVMKRFSEEGVRVRADKSKVALRSIK